MWRDKREALVKWSGRQACPPAAVHERTKQPSLSCPPGCRPLTFGPPNTIPIHTPYTQGQVFHLAADGVRVSGGSAGVFLSFSEQQANFWSGAFVTPALARPNLTSCLWCLCARRAAFIDARSRLSHLSSNPTTLTHRRGGHGWSSLPACLVVLVILPV